jgi:hypothetical protein
MNLAPPSLAGPVSAHSISGAMRTDPGPLQCLSCYAGPPPAAIDTWLQHWLPVIVKCTVIGAVIGAVFLVAGFVVLWRTGWLRASSQEPPHTGGRATVEEVRTGSERPGGNADAGS